LQEEVDIEDGDFLIEYPLFSHSISTYCFIKIMK